VATVTGALNKVRADLEVKQMKIDSLLEFADMDNAQYEAAFANGNASMTLTSAIVANKNAIDTVDERATRLRQDVTALQGAVGDHAPYKSKFVSNGSVMSLQHTVHTVDSDLQAFKAA
jgi:hypothetical protein